MPLSQPVFVNTSVDMTEVLINYNLYTEMTPVVDNCTLYTNRGNFKASAVVNTTGTYGNLYVTNLVKNTTYSGCYFVLGDGSQITPDSTTFSFTTLNAFNPTFIKPTLDAPIYQSHVATSNSVTITFSKYVQIVPIAATCEITSTPVILFNATIPRRKKMRKKKQVL